MAIYESGSATDVLDLLVKLRTFALANGFAINFAGARTSGAGQALQLTKGPLTGTFLGDTAAGVGADPGPMLGTYCHNAYAAGGGTENQAGAADKTWANHVLGAFQAYHFFTAGAGDPPYLYAVVETAPGIYKHCGIGQLVQAGAFVTGLFNFATRWSYDPSYIDLATSPAHAIAFDSADTNSRRGPATMVRADSDGFSPRWLDTYGKTGHRLYGGFRNTVHPALVNAGTSAMTGSSIRPMCLLLGERLNGIFSPLGFPPGVRWARLDNVAPGHVAYSGSEAWKLFPIIRKNGTAGQPNSDVFGYAYRIN